MNNPLHYPDNSADVEIAGRITNALIVRGIDKKSLAEQVGLSYTTLRRSLEQDRGDCRSLSIRELGRIAKVLDVPASVLLPEALTARSAA
jgi:transcriptional regulator with XRE-family HTH domain